MHESITSNCLLWMDDSIATRYGTTWQHIRKLNPSIVPDEKNLFAGQLLCLAPDLAFITCRHGNLP